MSMSKLNEDDDLSLPSESELSDDDDNSFLGDNNVSDDENDEASINEEEEDAVADADEKDEDNPHTSFGTNIKKPHFWSDEEDNFSNEDDNDNYENKFGGEDDEIEEEEEDIDAGTATALNVQYGDDNDSDDDFDDDEEEEESAEKITEDMRNNILDKYHPESNVISREELYELCKVTRDSDNIIIDENHKTTPILTKYEKTKILGLRAKQINNGAEPHKDVKLPTNLHDVNESTVQQLQDKHFDGYLVAVEELKQKKIPVIIRRPLPNGTSEYWPLQELEVYM